MRLPHFLAALLLACCALAFAQAAKPAQAATIDAKQAQAYFDAYARFDMEALKAFYDDESEWSDPTATEIGATLGPARGPQAIVDLLQSCTRGVRDLHFVFDPPILSGEYGVVTGRLYFTMPAAMIGPNGADTPFDMRVVTVVRMRGGKVREHLDYTDYRIWRDTLAAARR